MNIQLKQAFHELQEEISSRIDQVDTTKYSQLQNYLYFINYPLFSFAESIIILCESGKNHTAKVLLRSMIEAHINIIYHQVGDSERRLAISAKYGFDQRIKGIRELKELIRKYPTLESADPTNLYSKEWLTKAEEWVQKEIRAIVKGNNLQNGDEDLDLKSKAIKCDEANIKDSAKGHFEQIYQVIFRQLSPTSHLNVEGLQTFVTKNETGEYLFDDGDDGDSLIRLAIDLCIAFTKDLYEWNLIQSPITDKVSRIETLLKEEKR